MTKEEILEKSRNENRSSDLFDLSIQGKAMRIGFMAGILMDLAVFLFLLCLTKEVHYELLMIAFFMETIVFAVKFFSMHKKHELLVFILYALLFIASAFLFASKLIG